MISAIFFMNIRGDVLITRVYRDDVNRGIGAAFKNYVLGTKEVRSPVKRIGGTIFCHIRHGDLYVVAVTKQNLNIASAFEVLHKLVAVFVSYFKKFNEQAVRGNFVLIYELLDEILDFGYPQNCSDDVLKMYITQGGSATELSGADKISKITIQATGAIPWRGPDIKYKHNQLFIDVVESVNLLMGVKGNVLHADVSGQVIMKAELSGMPECSLGMNDRAVAAASSTIPASAPSNTRGRGGIEIDDINFHQCVRLHRFDTDRTISFVPPDGQFELMKYRITESINFPFKVFQTVNEIGHSRLDMKITLKSVFGQRLIASDVVVKIPTPKNTAVARINCASGRAKYIPDLDAIVWQLRRVPGSSETTLSADIDLFATVSLDKKVWVRPPISLEFQVPMFTSSALHIRFLKVVEKSHYQTIKWVRYLTKAGNYQIRI